MKEELHLMPAVSAPEIQSAPGFCEGGTSPDASGQCPGDSVAPGFCEGGTSPDASGQCPGDSVSSRIL